MSRMVRAAREASGTSQYILLRGVPRSCTQGDIRRSLLRAGIQGVEKVEINYSHFRPTSKALLTLSSPSYLPSALSTIHTSGLLIGSIPVEAEAVYDPTSSKVLGPVSSGLAGLAGDGPSAGNESGKTVTLTGLSGKATVNDVWKLVRDEGLDVKKVLFLRLPPKKFSLYQRFILKVDSESEAQRVVRKLHVTDKLARDEGVPVRAEIIY